MTDTTRFWSVTTLTKLGMGSSRPLVEWNARMPAETAFDKFRTLQAFVEDGDRAAAVKWLMDSRHATSGAAKARGSAIHAAAEALALGAPVEIEEELMPYVQQYADFLQTFKPEFIMAEAPVYSEKYSYAGTTDGIFKIDGQRLIFDIKTTAVLPGTLTEGGKPKHRGPYDEIALQLAAYRHAEKVGLLSDKVENYYGRYYVYDRTKHYTPMPETDGALAIMLSPADYRVIPVRTDEDIFRCFLAARECARFNVEVSKTIFGPQLGTPNTQGVLS